MAALKKLETCGEDTIAKNFYAPTRRLLEDLREEPTRLFTRFEEATMGKRREEAEEILAVLNLRCREGDRKVKDFVKKYKGSLQK